MLKLKKYLAHPFVAGVVCALLAAPARPFGHEAAQAFRWLINYTVSKSDLLFDLAAHSNAAVGAIRSGQAWGSWLIYGFITAIIAALITRWLAKTPLSWSSIVVVVTIWIGIYLFIWRWDNDLHFALSAARTGLSHMAWGPWPLAGSFGFFTGFTAGFVLAGAPWRTCVHDGG